MPTSSTLTDRARDPATFTQAEKRLNEKLARVARLADDLRHLVEECLDVPESIFTAVYGQFGADSIRIDLTATPRDLALLRDTIQGFVGAAR